MTRPAHTCAIAIDEHIERRRADKDFIERLRKRHQAENELYERLSG